MKIVKKTISLPQDAIDFAEKQAAEVARQKSETPNFSGYIKDLILEQKRKLDAKLAKAA
jgi:hypothetical protein